MIQGDRYAHFPNAQVLISRREWRAAQGLAGRLPHLPQATHIRYRIRR
jgi:hypothetical protein